jgi:hypothetical protein
MHDPAYLGLREPMTTDRALHVAAQVEAPDVAHRDEWVAGLGLVRAGVGLHDRGGARGGNELRELETQSQGTPSGCWYVCMYACTRRPEHDGVRTAGGSST